MTKIKKIEINCHEQYKESDFLGELKIKSDWKIIMSDFRGILLDFFRFFQWFLHSEKNPIIFQ
jgi:hypothetical protein